MDTARSVEGGCGGDDAAGLGAGARRLPWLARITVDDRVRGFAGSGVKFDRALLASASYSFNIAEVLRIEGTLDWARVRDTTLRDLPLPHPPSSSAGCLGCDQDFTGFGLSGNVMGPWSTLVRFERQGRLGFAPAVLEDRRRALALCGIGRSCHAPL